MAESQQQSSTSQTDSQPSADQLLSALEKAHLAGDTQAAREFAAWHQELYAPEPEPEEPGMAERGANALRSLVSDSEEQDAQPLDPEQSQAVSEVADYGRRGPAPQRTPSQSAAPPPEVRREPEPTTPIDTDDADERSARNAPGAQTQRADQQQTEPQSPEVDAFTGADRSAPEEAPDFNMARGAGERVGDLAGGLLTTIRTLAGMTDVPLGGQAWQGEADVGEEDAERLERARQDVAKLADQAGDLDLGYVPTHTWEAVKEEFGEEGPLSGSAWAEVASYGAEQGIKSIPDMVAVTLNLPGYVLARSGEIGEARAENKGKEQAELSDVLEAAPAALGSAILERIGARSITEAGAESVGKEALKRGVGYATARTAQEGARAAGREAGTEAVQEGIIEYVGERFGTDAAMSFAEGAEMGLAGAVAGGVYGGAAGTATSGAREATRRSPEAEVGRAMQQEADALQPTDDGSRVAAGRLDPEMAQLTTAPEASDRPAPTRKSMGELVREKLAERGVTTPQAEGYRDTPSIAPAFSDDAEARANWERAWRDQGMADPNAEIPDTTIDIEEQRQPDQEAVSESQTDTLEPTPTQEADRLTEEQTEAISARRRNRPLDYTGYSGQTRQARSYDEVGDYRVAKVHDGMFEVIDSQGQAVSQRAGRQGAIDYARQLQQEGVGEVEANIEQAADETDTTPTEAQAEAGNYRKGRVRVQGMEIAIENPRGSTRRGTDDQGNQWESRMAHHYGDIKGTTAADGDNLDVFIGPNPESEQVFVIDQVNDDGSFDEHKVMLGFDTQQAARQGYLDNYEEGWQGLGAVSAVDMDGFTSWVERGDHTKPWSRRVTRRQVEQETEAQPETSDDQPTATPSGEAVQEGRAEAPRPISQAETGEPLQDTGYRVEGIDPATLYQSAQVPILGQGQYLATSADGARSFSQDDNAQVTETRVSLDNPLVIRSDNEWRVLTKEAGWEAPNPFDQRSEQVRQGVEALQSLARERGHDGIAVLWDNSTPYDIDDQGRSIKLLRDVFSEPQVVAFGKSQNPKASQPRRRRGDTSAMRSPTTRVGESVTAEEAEAELLEQMDEADRQLFSDEEWQQMVDDQRQSMQREVDAAANLPEGFEAFGDFIFDGQTLRRDGEEVGSLSLRIEDDGERRLVIDDIRIRRRGRGTGTEAIRAIVDRASELEIPVALTAETMQGRQTQRRLRDYYQRLGFTRNRGRDRVRGITEEFYLAPEGVTLTRANRQRRGGDTNAMRMPDSPIEQGDNMASHASPWADSPADTADMAGDVSNAGQDSPMPNWVPTYRQRGVLPRRPESGEFELGERTVQLKPEDQPTRREGIRVMVTDLIGPRLYQGKVQGKTRLGFYRQSNSEVRIANFDDVEVMAHEMAHYLDLHYRYNDRFSEAYNDADFKGEVEGLSYTSDPDLRTTEGFAEFVRLWLTQYDEAQQQAPKFTAKFETVLARDKALDRKMTRLQEEMHRWYRQGDLAQAYAVTSGNQYTTGQQVTMLLNGRPGELWRQRYIDKIHAAKVMERTLGGDIADAGQSAYKQMQLLNGIEGISQESFKHGAPVIGEDGDITFKGPSLKDVWSESLRKGPRVLREQELYFVARRAQELKRQGRERLISDGMMREGLAMADKHPHVVQAFDDYQTYRTNMMEFYVESGYITADAARAMLNANQNYVPFHRVVEGVNAAYTGGTGFMRLKGGQQNIKPVYDNMMMQEQRHLYAALKARALRQLYSDALKHQDGSLFLSKIAPDSKPVEVAIDQMTNKTAEAMAEMGVSIAEDGTIAGDGETVVDKSDLQSYFEQNPEELMFWTFGHKPNTTETMVDSFIDGRGKRVWVEIQKDNQLLVDMLDSMDYVGLPPGALGTAVKLAMKVKNFQTLTITSMAQFVGPNMVRDAQQAFTLSGGKFRPVWDTMIGLGGQLHAIISDKAAWHEMKAQGGPVAGRVRTFYSENWGLASDVAYAPRKPFYHPSQLTNTLLDVYMAIADSAEISTRLGFYMRMRQEVGAREAAWQAREISTDFRKHGSYASWVLLQRTVPFLGAYVQSVDRDIRALADNQGEMKLANMVKTESGRATLNDMKVRVWMAGGLLIGLTMLLSLLNEDEERYQALTPDQKARFYHLFIGGRHYTIPKPHGFISLIAQAGETTIDTLTTQSTEDAADVMKFAIAYHFGSDAMPGVINPVAEVALNRSFTGAPIVSRYAQDREARYQYDDRTPLLYVNVGRELNISPDQAHHVVRGYTGYLSDFVDELSEKLLWDNQEWGERPFARDFGDMMNKQFKPREVPYRTKWTTGYYELRRRAAAAQANLSFLQREEARRDTGPLEEFASDKVNGTLLGINKAFNRIDDAFSDQDTIIAGIKYDPDLTAEEKEAEIEAYYAKKNETLAEFYQQVDEALSEVEDEVE